MSAKLIAVTKPLIEGINTAEEFIAYAARVSNPSNQMNVETAPKLLKYLIKHKHWSPMEMVSITMEIKCSRTIGRQVLRHRSFSFQEFSGRYATNTGFSYSEARLQDTKNRQNSIETSDTELQDVWQEYQAKVLQTAKAAHDWAISNGIAKEVARNVLPEGMTDSILFMSGTLRSWIHYCQLRCGPETQKEHREVAQEAWNAILVMFPTLEGILSE